LKKFLLITSIILLTATYSQGQVNSSLTNGGSLVHFYPNPATSSITFDFQKPVEKGYSIQLYSFLGKKVFESANLGQRTFVNLSDFNRGVYIYQIYDRNGKLVESGKFQVSR
jgi:hypothetical protein